MTDIPFHLAGAGALGMIGSGITAVVGFFGKKQQNAHNLAIRKLEIEEGRLEAERAEKQQAHETAMVERESRTAELAGTIKEATTRISTGPSTLLNIADFVRMMMRPMLMLLLFALLVVAHSHDWDTNQIMFLLTTGVMWYFGDRGLAKLNGGK